MTTNRRSVKNRKKDDKVMISFQLPKDLVAKMDVQSGKRERNRSSWLRKLIEASLYSSENTNVAPDASTITMVHELNRSMELGLDELEDELVGLIQSKLDDYRKQWRINWMCPEPECGGVLPEFAGCCPALGCTGMQFPNCAPNSPLLPALRSRPADSRKGGI